MTIDEARKVLESWDAPATHKSDAIRLPFEDELAEALRIALAECDRLRQRIAGLTEALNDAQTEIAALERRN